MGTLSWKSSISSYEHSKQVSPWEEQKKSTLFESSIKLVALPKIDRSHKYIYQEYDHLTFDSMDEVKMNQEG